MRRTLLTVAATTTGILTVFGLAAPAALAKPAASHNGGAATGIDASYPQCGSTLPSGQAFAIIGVNDGLANDYNPCLGAEFHYAETQTTGLTHQAAAQTYLNTADPGNGVADWPSPSQPGAYGATTTPDGTCDFAAGTSGPGADSTACAYVYGYDMVAGIAYAGGSVAGDQAAFASATGGSLVATPVWLDVETGNSWQSGSSGAAMNVADLQGMVAALKSGASTAAQIGIYSTGYQWGQITGGSTAGDLQGLPVWIPGASRESGAAANCTLASFTGGSVTVTQWFGHPYDGDYSCVG